MVAIQLNKQDFEYDVHSLVKAFYPDEDVSVFYGEDQEEAAGILTIRIRYQEHEISIGLLDKKDSEISFERVSVDFYQDRAETKNVLKRLLYRMLSKYTRSKLPWGTLTGIRPTKIPMALLDEGKKNTEIAAYIKETYDCSNEKTALCISIANREKHILTGINEKDGYSLYIGIPFCPSICFYCSFSSSPIHIWKDKTNLYLDALCKEIAYGAEAYRDKVLQTVYIGGGTPTTLTAEELERLFSEIEQHFDLSRIIEYTVEAGRPDSITREKLEVLKRHEITRISINPQTMNQRTLEVIGRHHTTAEIKAAFYLAREVGFDNINMDLIVGLPGEQQKEVEYTLEEVAALDPDSVTIHSLAVKRAARLNMFRDEYKEMTFTNNQEIMDRTSFWAARMNMAPYYLYRQKNMKGNFENVGYAKEGKEGIYNILIMEEKQSILALGAGATTKIVNHNINRIENVKDIKTYLERIDELIERKRQGFLKYGK